MFIKYLSSKIMSSFFSKLFGEKRFVYSVKVLPLNLKSINSIKKYPHITESHACTLKMFVLMFLFLVNALISFGICNLKRIKISNIVIIIHMESNWMSSNIRILIKIYYICPILYFRQIISRINTIKSWFIFIFLYF